MSNEEKPKSFRFSKGTFKITETDLHNQVENYYSLPITKSYRGIASLLIVAAVAMTALLYFVNDVDQATVVFAAIIYLPLAYFTYRGKKWAMVGAMAMWTIDKAYQIVTFPNPVIILWWVVFMVYFYKAYKIEAERHKKLSGQLENSNN